MPEALGLHDQTSPVGKETRSCVLPTRQGVRLHLAHHAPCKSTHQVALAQHQVRVYDPFDPETHPRDDEPSAGWQSEAMDVEFDQLDPPLDTSMDDGLASNP
ncbi:hypothetical protein JB92DRAFT_3118128 [Gautieria morchelliformis]|nr:hypothetical protein JB92DRAFT_3118128 [Gautieria morchelliformis]